MHFDITYDFEPEIPKYKIEVTENYEGDKWHAAVFITHNEHQDNFFEARGFDTPSELFDYVHDLANLPFEIEFYENNYKKTHNHRIMRVTKNYEGHKWQVDIYYFDDNYEIITQASTGFDTPAGVIEYLRELGNFQKD